MIKCKYCDLEAEWINPYNKVSLCGDHAMMKLKQLNEEFKVNDTLKDWFRKISYESDELNDGSWDLKNHRVIQN